MAGFDHSALDGLGYVVAVKQAWVDLPFADAVVGVDLPWMGWAGAELERLAREKSVYLAVPDQRLQHDPIPGATYLRRLRSDNHFSDDPHSLECAGNSGFAALNLAWLKRARRIVLFGFDFHGVHHAPGHYAARNRPVNANDRYLARWAVNFNSIQAQIERAGAMVVNASPNSVITAFPKVSQAEALRKLRTWADECAE